MTVLHRTLSNRTVAALKVGRDTVFWDPTLIGFWVRVYPSGGKLCIAQARERTGKKLPKRVRQTARRAVSSRVVQSRLSGDTPQRLLRLPRLIYDSGTFLLSAIRPWRGI